MKKISILLSLVLIVFVGFYFSFNKKTLNQNISVEEKQDVDSGSNFDEEILHGKWQSIDDKLFVRVLNGDNTFQDVYGDNEVTSSGTWFVFDAKNKPEDFAYPVESGKTYLTMNDTNLSMSFLISDVSSERLELIYLDAGGVLQFNKVK
jgi:hypothetical protein